ncbi:hypothetical protein ACFQPA_12590 [Halomarina halobia]|uniref:PGF-CTERM sorting domain-containing protein n=1 Tax=Halomarina halobia TaxID=3033386 RepID=A0ABD6AAQ8_9EURY|nr:hypothetical protein [Halomarina sp. PSR21]
MNEGSEANQKRGRARSRRALALALLVVVAVAPAVASAAEPHRYSGTVTYPGGEEVPGKIVTATHDGTVVATDITDGRGEYAFDVPRRAVDGNGSAVTISVEDRSRTVEWRSGGRTTVNFVLGGPNRTETPTPEPTPEPTPNRTETPTPSPTPTPTPNRTATPTPEPTPTESPQETATATATETATETPRPTESEPAEGTETTTEEGSGGEATGGNAGNETSEAGARIEPRTPEPETRGSGPGFTLGGGALAVVAAALFALRRR